mmetsp:Transcript_34442/g.83055  ORF Transcript_34442/g.83055 Transcript_34442/m.83055 type:complete len:169 (+) Transcript_34442:788-1294(+)
MSVETGASTPTSSTTAATATVTTGTGTTLQTAADTTTAATTATATTTGSTVDGKVCALLAVTEVAPSLQTKEDGVAGIGFDGQIDGSSKSAKSSGTADGGVTGVEAVAGHFVPGKTTTGSGISDTLFIQKFNGEVAQDKSCPCRSTRDESTRHLHQATQTNSSSLCSP